MEHSFIKFKKKIVFYHQGSDDFTTYFTKLARVWDELQIVQAITSCTCVVGVEIMKLLEDQRLIQMLMGLDELFKVTRG